MCSVKYITIKAYLCICFLFNFFKIRLNFVNDDQNHGIGES